MILPESLMSFGQNDLDLALPVLVFDSSQFALLLDDVIRKLLIEIYDVMNLHYQVLFSEKI